MNKTEIKFKIITALSEKDKVSVNDLVDDIESFFEVYNVVMDMIENKQLTLITRNQILPIEEIDRYLFFISYVTDYKNEY